MKLLFLLASGHQKFDHKRVKYKTYVYCVYIYFLIGKDGAINKLSGDDLHMDILQHLPETDPDTLISR